MHTQGTGRDASSLRRLEEQIDDLYRGIVRHVWQVGRTRPKDH